MALNLIASLISADVQLYETTQSLTRSGAPV